jgi:hypothetical protein
MMKKVIPFLLAGLISLFTINLNAQIYIDEDFSTFTDSIVPPIPSGWKNIDSLSPPNGQIWRFDNPSGLTIASPINGRAAIIDSDWYGNGNSQDAYLVSPSFDASLATVVILEFDHEHNPLANTADVEVFDGTNWVVVASYGNSNIAAQTQVIDISNEAAGISNAAVRFHYAGSWDWWWIIDNVSIFQPVPGDLATISVDSLTSGCNLDSVQVSATVVNVGSTTINGFDLNFTVNDTAQVTEVIGDTLLPGDTLRYTFNQLAGISTIATYDIDVFTFSRNDNNNVNDTATGTILNLPVTNTFPYTEDFESGSGGWLPGGTNSSWQLGTPNNTVISSAAGGTQAYVTNLTGNYNDSESSFVISPCFDFGNLTRPQIKMDIFVESEDTWDGAILQSSIDRGLTWQTVGVLNDPVNWYNDNTTAIGNLFPSDDAWTGNSPFSASAGWVLAERDLTGLGGEPSVRLRVFFASDGIITEEGFAFDNILIQEAPSADAGLVEVVRPFTNCGLGAADSVEIRIQNPGSAAISNFGVSYILNAGPVVNETFTGTINPGDSANYVFSATVNLSAIGTYNLRTYSSLANDGNPTNDTLDVVIENIPIVSTFPYTEGFETGNGGWVSGGTANSWQNGAPAGNVINSAASGTQAYVTNLSGTYNNNEVSFVVGPCFDFTNLSQPQIQFDMWIENESGFDGTILESSIDGGQTWQKVGALNDPINWYNDNTFTMGLQSSNGDCWSDQSPFSATPGWVIAQRRLTGLGGQPAVQLRFLHVTDGSVIREGFAFDNIQIDDAPSADAEVISISAPQTSCGLTATDTIKVLLTNVGSAAIDSIPIAYTVNGASLYRDTSFALINPGDTIEFAFDTAYDFSAAGSYRIFAQSSLAGDATTFNDSASAIVTNTINTLQTLPYLENFDGPNFTGGTGFANAGSVLGNGWVAIPESPNYFWGVRNGPTGSGGTGPDADHTTGSANFVYVEGSNGANNDVAELYSPCIDLGGTTAPQLEFWYHKYGTNMPTLFVDVFDGNTWVQVDSIVGQTQTANTDPYLNRNVGLAAFAGNTIQVRFRSGGKTGFTNDMAIDDFRVFEPTNVDGGISAVTSPLGGCGLGAADSVTVTIINAGTNTLDTVPVGYTLNFGGLVVDTSFATIPPAGSVSFTFSTPVNLSAPGTYFIDAFTLLTGDGNSANDTANAGIQNEPVVSFPYFEDFETSSGNWAPSGTNPSWAWGSPAGIYIANAGSGNNAWVTNLSGPYNNSELSYVESPCIDMSNLTNDPTLEFLHTFETEDGFDEGWLELSTDGGQNWSKVLSSPTAVNWYNDSLNQWWEDTSAAGPTNWQIASNDLLGAAGNVVKIRFSMSSDGSVINEGFGIDSVSIDLSISVAERSRATNELMIFPNPSEGQFILRSELGKEYEVMIMNSNGQVVYDRRLSFNASRDHMIDLSGNAKGLYFVRLMNEGEVITKKVIVQ